MQHGYWCQTGLKNNLLTWWDFDCGKTILMEKCPVSGSCMEEKTP